MLLLDAELEPQNTAVMVKDGTMGVTRRMKKKAPDKGEMPGAEVFLKTREGILRDDAVE